ncbi:MAG: 16S rRNA (guanine(966)-N(2))-methyltransferase RsmD [Lachnospiraceae bacterium]|nr:16S rRNA (guanine(966)-N(2))-methyltransferase RsmD [Lachnospiraceae bacterium]
MRVIAGSARRITLTTPAGLDTRPTTDRIKETLFNILQPELPGCCFLDLFAGSGGIGIEALSRGASEAVFVENSRKAVVCIQENLKKTHFEKQSAVFAMDALAAINRLDSSGRAFDIIFLDPPYGKGLQGKVLAALTGSNLVHEDTLVIFEESLDVKVEEMDLSGFEIERIKEYKTNMHVFLKPKVKS